MQNRQDGNGNGTVIARHTAANWVRVRWLGGGEIVYRYGADGQVDVVQVHAARRVVQGFRTPAREYPPLFVGDLVVRGPNWKWDRQARQLLHFCNIIVVMFS